MIESPFEEDLSQLEKLEEFCLSGRYCVAQVQGDTRTLIQRDGQGKSFPIPSSTLVQDSRNHQNVDVKRLRSGDSFSLLDRFEVIDKNNESSTVRTSRGFVVSIPHSTPVHVRRCNNLSRGPGGTASSKVAMASFDVAHVISKRTVQVNASKSFPGELREIRDGEEGFISAVRVSLTHKALRVQLVSLKSHSFRSSSRFSVHRRCPGLSSLHGKS